MLIVLPDRSHDHANLTRPLLCYENKKYTDTIVNSLFVRVQRGRKSGGMQFLHRPQKCDETVVCDYNGQRGNVTCVSCVNKSRPLNQAPWRRRRRQWWWRRRETPGWSRYILVSWHANSFVFAVRWIIAFRLYIYACICNIRRSWSLITRVLGREQTIIKRNYVNRR